MALRAKLPEGLVNAMARFAMARIEARAARDLPACDALIAMSGVGYSALNAARMRGVLAVCDRGSAHVLAQDAWLRAEGSILGLRHLGVDRAMIQRELADYAAADVILTPSDFARQTFLDRGFAPDNVVTVPLGNRS